MVPKQDIIKAALNGVSSAHHFYYNCCGEWLWKAPEYLLTTHVAEKLSALQLGLTLENRAVLALKDAGARGRGRLHSDLRGKNGKFDILLWSSEKPKAPIEIKIQVESIWQIRKDMKRIIATLNRNNTTSSIEFGAIVFYTSIQRESSAEAAERIDKCFDSIVRSSKNDYEKFEFSLVRTDIVEDYAYNSAWAGAALSITRKSA